jgi:hypothetical protein
MCKVVSSVVNVVDRKASFQQYETKNQLLTHPNDRPFDNQSVPRLQIVMIRFIGTYDMSIKKA